MSEELVIVLSRSALAIALFMLAVWYLSLLRKDASIVDVAWGLGFVLVGWTAFWCTTEARLATYVLPVLTTVWGLRLSGYLFWRNHDKPEDYRYQAMREKWGTWFPAASLVTVFALQGGIMWVVSLPVQAGVALSGAAPEGRTIRFSTGLLVLGVAIWSIGLFFETVGDLQLARFKADPGNVGRVLDRGLWRLTRHPNYFGDFLVWWGIFFVAVSQSRAWWCVIGPVVMSIFLMRISGVTLLEKRLVESKSAYSDYIRRTNAFFPGPPKP